MGTKLMRSNRDRKIMGVCGGIAEYLHIDSTLVRIIWAIAVCCFGSGILLYLIAGAIMPQDMRMGNSNWNRNSWNDNYSREQNYNYNTYDAYNNYNTGNTDVYDASYNTNYETVESNNNNTGYYSGR